MIFQQLSPQNSNLRANFTLKGNNITPAKPAARSTCGIAFCHHLRNRNVIRQTTGTEKCRDPFPSWNP
jgi:hypothetical protein